jgi:anti-sigma B factor antagonist
LASLDAPGFSAGANCESVITVRPTRRNIRGTDGVVVLDLNGRITLGEGSVQLRDAIRGLIGQGKKNVLLNMGEVNYIDSSGLGELVSAYTTAKNQQAEVKLLKLTRKVHDLLQLTKLYTVFDIKDDEASAIASFK